MLLKDRIFPSSYRDEIIIHLGTYKQGPHAMACEEMVSAAFSSSTSTAFLEGGVPVASRQLFIPRLHHFLEKPPKGRVH